MRGDRSATPADQALQVEVVVFTLGRRIFITAREDVKAIRPSRRVRGGEGGGAAVVHSLSRILDLERDTSVDARVLEIEYWGERLGLEVTSIAGIRFLRRDALFALPPMTKRCCGSGSVLGIVTLEGDLAVALDLPGLVAERGVALTP